MKEDRLARIRAGQPKENVKTAEFNLAKLGSQADLKGIKYSQDKSVKKYLGDRKRSIGNISLEDDIERESEDRSKRPESQRQSVSLPPIVKDLTQDKETTTMKLLQKLKEKQQEREKDEFMVLS